MWIETVIQNAAPLFLLAIFVLWFLALAIRVFREYERGVVFTLGRFTRVAGPGLVIVIPVIQQVMKTDLRTVVDVVPPQDVITRDNVSVKVNAVIYYRMVDPQRAIINVANYMAATSQLAQTTLRSVLGQARAGRAAGGARQAQRRHPGDPRSAYRPLGHQGFERRDQGCRSQ